MPTPEMTEAFTKQFTATVEAKLQLTGSRLLSAVDTGMYTGNGAEVVKQVGTIELDESTVSNAATNYGDVPHDTRWVYPRFFDKAVPIDDQDAVRTIANFESPYTSALAYGAARKIESILGTGFFADCKTGKEGGTTTSFDSAMQVAVNEDAASNVGMTVAKLLKGKQLLKKYYAINPGDQVWCAMTALQELNLMKEVNFTSGDYNANRPLGEGNITSFLGVNFIVTEELPVDGSSYRRCPMWVKSGMHLGRWLMKAEVFRDPGRKNNWATQIKTYFGVTRTQERKVVEIKCAES